ncbi:MULTISPECIES: type VII secretion integral membrane protein EccD [Streptomyces]|uniref:Type VII secretion integral membrane protein EccD n=3 Tax=Streptomyces TaxID=1883 RepID=A0A1I6VWS6_9ACTN|nr:MULTISPECIES: type VII secretion integral membrane protein EccD [Streptomyces]QKV71221.1 type VII secretion integral membrane protein EccD [Streptomyces harbinensis]SFT18157.1 type VII secretion integral membrane protein EccD [Streptomyces harbinensis]
MNSTAATGFCRVTVAAPDSRIDVALPEDLPLADLYAQILQLTGQAPAEGAPVGYHLLRRDGSVLDGARTLAAQRVLDGEVLVLRPVADALPPPVHDDVSEAVADAVTHDRALWHDQRLRTAGLTGAAVLATVAAAVLWYADPVHHDLHGLPGIIAGVLALLLTSFAVVRARVYADRPAAVAAGLAALPHGLIAGTGALPLAEGHGVGRLELLLGCVAVLLLSVVAAAALPDAAAPFVATATAALIGTLATFAAIVADARPVSAAALTAPVAIGALGFLPGLSAALVRLPIGYDAPRTGFDTDDPDQAPPTGEPIDAERIAAQARLGHQLLLGLTAGCALAATVAVAVLGFAGDGWAQLLALATAGTLLTRSRLFRYAVQVSVLLVAGLAALTLLATGFLLHPPAGAVRDLLAGDSTALDLRTLWLTAALAAAAAVMTAIALIVPRSGLTPFWGRVLDLTESALLLSLIPLCLAVLGVYARARGLTSD